ncbi:hypothetical protein HK096_007267 [Nowakowskiella sp. JEL0078]|nr:hypothetical protein HK096_007267 [Nowakowskiella sp. JEL0078]
MIKLSSNVDQKKVEDKVSEVEVTITSSSEVELGGNASEMETTKIASDVSFNVAKGSTKFGLSISKSIISGISDSTGLTSLGLTSVINGTLTFAEWIACNAIDTGRFWTNIGLSSGRESIKTLNNILGSTDTAQAIVQFVKLIDKEIRNPHPATMEELTNGTDDEALIDKRSKIAIERPGFSVLFKNLTAWACLQYLTRESRKTLYFETGEIKKFDMTKNPSDETFSEEIVFDTEDTNNDKLEKYVFSGTIGHKAASMNSVPDLINNDVCLILDLQRFVKYGSGAYGPLVLSLFNIKGNDLNLEFSDNYQSLNSDLNSHPHHVAISRHVGLAINSVLHSTFKERSHESLLNNILSFVTKSDASSNKYQATFFVIVDHSKQEIIVSFRGTLSLEDLMVDLTCEYEDYSDANETTRLNLSITKVHSGMMHVARLLANESSIYGLHHHIEKSLNAHPDYCLVLTGHSLGGGIASLLTLLWADPTTGLTRPKNENINPLPLNRKCRCVAFGSPCTMSKSLAAICSRDGFIVSVLNQDDVVGRLSLGTIKDARNIATAFQMHVEVGVMNQLWSDTVSFQDWKKAKAMGKVSGSWKGIMDWEHLRSSIEKEAVWSELLYPPGRLLWIQNEKNGQFEKLNVVEVLNVSKVFGYLEMSEKMLAQHLPHSYEVAINAL